METEVNMVVPTIYFDMCDGGDDDGGDDEMMQPSDCVCVCTWWKMRPVDIMTL